jgi:hypothetical protein
MSFAAKDGKKFGNRQRQQKYDSMHSTRSAPPDAQEAASDQQSVAAQHGPASSIQITSQHPDGHIQKSVHQTADDAKSAVDSAAGDNPAEEAQESPEVEQSEQAPPIMAKPAAKPAMKSTKIPGLK